MNDRKNIYFGLKLGSKYFNTQFENWGPGIVFLDNNKKLKIDFNKNGIKSILNESAASKLRPAPEGIEFINNVVYLQDGQLVVIVEATISTTGITHYKIFREEKPRIFFTNIPIRNKAEKNINSMKLMNEWFKFKRGLSTTKNAIRMSIKQQRTTHCYNCNIDRLDSNEHFECNLCKWIICPLCGACGCGYRR